MRHSLYSLFAAVSLTALIGFSASAAAPVAADFGSLKAQDAWRVGTIDNEDGPYCAMVSKYDKDVFLAFARDDAGYGSLALDVSNDLFTSNLDYEVTLTAGAAKPSNFSAHASSPRSVVVQIGKNDGFYAALDKADKMAVSLPVLKASFDLKGFTAAHKDLVACSNDLGRAKNTTAKIDASQSPLNVPAEQTGTKVAAADIPQPAIDNMEKQLKQEKQIEAAQSKQAIEWFDDKQGSLESQLAAEKKAVAGLEAEKTGVERKLLATTSAAKSQQKTTPVETAAIAGKTAQQLEQEQLAAIRQRPAPAPVAVADKDAKSVSKSATASTPLLIEKKAGGTSAPVLGAASATPAAVAVAAAQEAKKESKPVEVASLQEAPKPEKAKEEKAKEAAPQPKPAVAAAAPAPASVPAAPADNALVQERDSLKRQLDQALAFNAMTAPSPEKSVDPALDAKYKKLNDDLGRKQAAIADMEKQMQQVEAARLAEAERAAKAQADLKFAQEQLEKMKKGEELAKADLAKAEQIKAEQLKAAQAKKAELAKPESAKLAAASAPDTVMPPTSPDSMPAVPSPSVDSELIGAPAIQPNRAAAFLDRIMSYHRPGGAAPASVTAVTAPVTAKAAPVAAPPAIVVPKEEEEAFLAVLNARPIVDVTEKPAETKVAESKAPVVSAAPAAEPAAKMSSPPVVSSAPIIAPPPVKPESRISAPPVMNDEKPVVAAVPKAPAPAEVSPELEKMLTEVADAPVEVQKAEPSKKAEAAKAVEKETVKPVVAAAPVDLSVPPPMPSDMLTLGQGAATKEQAPASVKAVKGAADAPARVSSDAPARVPLSVSEPSPMEMPRTTETPPVASAPVSSAPAIVSAPPAATQVEKAPLRAPAAPVPAPVPVPVAQVAPATPPGIMTLESLLQSSGGTAPQFVSAESAPGEVVRQWKSGKANGLFEQTTDGGGNFDAAMQNYLDRYREDCPGHLNVTVGEARKMQVGTIAPAAISCSAKGNAYATSFVFVQDAGKFNVIAHTGQAGEAAAMKSVSDRIVGTLTKTQRFIAPEAAVKDTAAKPMPAAVKPPVASTPAPVVPAVSAPVPPPAAVAAPEVLADPSIVRLTPPASMGQQAAPKKQLKFNIKENGKKPGDEFATVVIE